MDTPLASATELGQLKVRTADGSAIALSGLWAETTAVLVLVRHFG